MPSNKYLYFSPFRIGSISFEVVFDDILKVIDFDINNEVTILTCNGFLNHCSSNLEGSKLKCKLCSISSNYIFKKYEHKRIKIIDLGFHDCLDNAKQLHFSYNSFDDLKNIEYKGLNIGMGVVSSYVSFTRDLNPVFNKTLKDTIDKLLYSNCALIESLFNLGLDYKDYTIKVFNGRFSELRTFFNFFNGEVNTIEFVNTKIKNEFKRVEFEKSLPHSIEENTRRININWESYSEEERVKVAEDFFIRKLNNTSFQDRNYTKNQKKNKLPEDFDDEKINICYYVSSEDEIFAIGGRWDNQKLFIKQIDFLDFWLSNFKNRNNYHLYVRMHPNLKDHNFNFITDYYNYNIKNITVIEPSSFISSYALMFKSNAVIVSSSSIGFEANYYGIPTIQIGASWYSDLKISHQPRSLNELKNLIENRDLHALNKTDSMKMAFYLALPPAEKFHQLKGTFKTNRIYKYHIRNSYNFPKYYSLLNVLFRVFSLKSLIFKIRLKKI